MKTWKMGGKRRAATNNSFKHLICQSCVYI